MYRRSDTEMDNVSQFFPQSFIGLRGLGEDDAFSYDWEAADPYNYSPVDFGTTYPTDYTYGAGMPASVPAADNGGGIVDALKSLAPALRDIYLSANAAEAQKKVMDLNIARAQRGLPPINAAQYGLQPGVNVGMSPQMRRDFYTVGGVGLGTVAAVGVGAYLLLGSGRRRSRR